MSENKSESKFGIAGESFTVAAVLVAVPTVVFFLPVLNYNVPHNGRELAREQNNLYHATQDYYAAYDNAVAHCRDTLGQDSTYMGLIQQLYDMQDAGYNPENSKTYASLQLRADSVASNLCSEYIAKNKDLNFAKQWRAAVANRVAELQRDSVIRDSIVRQPFNTRFTNNWRQMRTDFHSTMARYHNNRIAALQNKKLKQR